MCKCANLTLIEGFQEYHDGFANLRKILQSFNPSIKVKFAHLHICKSAH